MNNTLDILGYLYIIRYTSKKKKSFTSMMCLNNYLGFFVINTLL